MSHQGTITNLPTHWEHFGRFAWSPIRDLPTWFITWALEKDFPERDIAVLRGERDFRIMVGDQWEGR